MEFFYLFTRIQAKCEGLPAIAHVNRDVFRTLSKNCSGEFFQKQLTGKLFTTFGKSCMMFYKVLKMSLVNPHVQLEHGIMQNGRSIFVIFLVYFLPHIPFYSPRNIKKLAKQLQQTTHPRTQAVVGLLKCC